MPETPWPKHPDGSNKKMGEMTQDERSAQWKAAGARLQAEFDRPEVRAGIAAVLDSNTSLPN